MHPLPSLLPKASLFFSSLADSAHPTYNAALPLALPFFFSGGLFLGEACCSCSRILYLLPCSSAPLRANVAGSVPSGALFRRPLASIFVCFSESVDSKLQISHFSYIS